MSALHKLKAYFGMVPADDIDDDYEDELGDDDRFSPQSGHYASYDSTADRSGSRRRFGGARGGYQDEADDPEDYPDDSGGSSRARRSWSSASPVRGSFGSDSSRESVSQLRAVTDTGTHVNLSKITTLHPRSYSEARTIGEQYRDGTPVIMNLTEMEEADAKRLVDFAAGLAFGLRGSIDKVTNRVFLLSPPNVDVAAEDKRRMAEGAFFNYG